MNGGGGTPVAIGAGCVVLRGEPIDREVLLVWTKRYPDPTLPKGKIEPGESAVECAIREVAEETGYEVEVLDDEPLVTETMLDAHEPHVLYRLHWFLSRSVGGSTENRTDPGLITRAGWVRIEEALSQLRRREEIAALRWAIERDGYDLE